MFYPFSIFLIGNREITIVNRNDHDENKKDKKNFVQLRIIDEPNPSVENRLTMAIADMIHSLGLPFSLSSDKKFRQVIRLSRAVGTTYVPPGRNLIAGELLDLNYEQYIRRHNDLLMTDIGVFGLTYFGDGATIKRTPFINILASGVHIPVAVLEIVDCSVQASSGNKKDAKYIASLFRPHIESMEANHPRSTDVLFFLMEHRMFNYPDPY